MITVIAGHVPTGRHVTGTYGSKSIDKKMPTNKKANFVPTHFRTNFILYA